MSFSQIAFHLRRPLSPAALKSLVRDEPKQPPSMEEVIWAAINRADECGERFTSGELLDLLERRKNRIGAS